MSGSAELLAQIEKLHPRVIDLSLGRMERLLTAMDHPERRLPPVIHVAGTNGKGSVIAFMRAILQAAGYRVQVFNSPHLVEFRERIRLSHGLIDEARLTEILQRTHEANAGQEMTFFEFITAAAFLAYAEDRQGDVLLLETGLGGRLDSTNMVDQPAATVITPISMDHMAFLGNSIPEIAAEKAGILKPGVPAIFAEQGTEAANVLMARASELSAPVIRAGHDFTIDAETGVFRDAGGEVMIPALGLPGAHQWGNAAVALATLRTLSGFSFTDDQIGLGLQSAEWPARLQPLCWKGRPDLPITLDGGHNQAAAGAMADWLRSENVQDPRQTHLVLGLLDNRDPVDFLSAFAGLPVSVHAVPIDGHAAHAPEVIARAAEGLGLAAKMADGVSAALHQVPMTDRALICGSLYLAGSVLADKDFGAVQAN